MPRFEVEQYEISVVKYRVEAAGEAEAIVKVLDGKAELCPDHAEHFEVAEDIGLPVDEYPELAEELRVLGVAVGDGIIPSIRSIREME